MKTLVTDVLNQWKLSLEQKFEFSEIITYIVLLQKSFDV